MFRRVCRDFAYCPFVVICNSGLKFTLIKLHGSVCSLIDLVLDVQEGCVETLFN